MMTNLFSVFDPSTTILNWPINWTAMILGLMFIPSFYWLIPNNYMFIFNSIMNTLYKEFSITIKNMNTSNLIFVSLFIFIVLNNSLGLFPYIFTSTSHLVFNLTMALPFWLSFLLFGWIMKSQQMFAHLVPQGTPITLISFMVLIETISNLIRPLALAVRLTANMIAGHLLLTLLSNLGEKLTTIFIPMLLFVQILLLILESAVAIIQAYVFAVLMTLYASEI